jgi:hypothetical protein
VAVQ